jgi:hypothetical protein
MPMRLRIATHIFIILLLLRLFSQKTVAPRDGARARHVARRKRDPRPTGHRGRARGPRRRQRQSRCRAPGPWPWGWAVASWAAWPWAAEPPLDLPCGRHVQSDPCMSPVLLSRGIVIARMPPSSCSLLRVFVRPGAFIPFSMYSRVPYCTPTRYPYQLVPSHVAHCRGGSSSSPKYGTRYEVRTYYRALARALHLIISAAAASVAGPLLGPTCNHLIV